MRAYGRLRKKKKAGVNIAHIVTVKADLINSKRLCVCVALEGFACNEC